MRPKDKLKSSVDACCVVGLPWETLGASEFRVPEHTNILEARALLQYVRLCVKEGRVCQRLIVIIDSGVVKGGSEEVQVFIFRSELRLEAAGGVMPCQRSLPGTALGPDLGKLCRRALAPGSYKGLAAQGGDCRTNHTECIVG